MKKFLALTILLLAALGVLAGCSTPERDEALVGTWSWTGNLRWEYVFEADGNGTRGDEGTETVASFTWSTDDNVLTINPGRNYHNEAWLYSFNDGVLTLTRRGDATESYTYIQIAHDQSLVGEWALEMYIGVVNTFNSDGTGTIDRETFMWATAGNYLVVDSGRMMINEHFTFSVSGRELTLTDRDNPSDVLEFLLLNDDPVLVGTWAWEGDDSYYFVFNADGTGIQNWGTPESFSWRVAGYDRVILDFGDMFDNHWHFEINGDIMTIDSLQLADFRFYYIRVN